MLQLKNANWNEICRGSGSIAKNHNVKNLHNERNFGTFSKITSSTSFANVLPAQIAKSSKRPLKWDHKAIMKPMEGFGHGVRHFATNGSSAGGASGAGGDNKKVSLVMIGNPIQLSDHRVTVPEQCLAVPCKKILFPSSWFPLEFSDLDYVKQLKSFAEKRQLVGVFPVKEGHDQTVTNVDQLEKYGVLCYVINAASMGSQLLYFHAVKRIQVTGPSDEENPMIAQIKEIEDEPVKVDKEYKAAAAQLLESLVKLIKAQETQQPWPIAYFQPFHALDQMQPAQIADIAAGRCLNASREELLDVLKSTDQKDRLMKVLNMVKKEMEIFDIKKNINKQIEDNIQKTHRKYLLMEQLKTIKKELGLEQDEKKTLIDKYDERLKKLTIPEHAMKVIKDEMAKLQTLEPSALEFNMTRSYLDWLTSIPWGVYSKENLDVKNALKVLDEDHYGLKDVKERILEFISVGKLKKGIQGKILCLVGPPGVGKTSIGKSIARALDRQFYRFSVGGLSDVAEIKGHRRTYVGSMPGKLIQCLKSAQTANPLVLIDEIDKLGKGYQGDPAAALLEVLDPSQNGAFMDHYLDVPVDISKVLFVCTANVQETIPGPLKDRMEVIQLSGYILEEKVAIAKKYLIPNALQDSGLTDKGVKITDEAVDALIRDYCREAGVRNLQKHIEKIFRKVAYKVVTGSKSKALITPQNLADFVGKPVFNSDRYYDKPPPGVVMGLAWTAMGGATLYVETVTDKVGGKPELRCTGQMGDVMKESTSIAYTYAKSFLDTVENRNRFFEQSSLHMHIPEGATPKDGPSAGCTMVTSLLSLALNKPVLADLAMTGEVTLTGKVLPIGGVKEKTIAAKRSGVKVIIFPKDNKKDWDELPDYIKKGLVVHFADYYKDIYKVALEHNDKKATATTTSSKTPRIRGPYTSKKKQKEEDKPKDSTEEEESS